MKQKITSLILCLTIILGLFTVTPVTASAQESGTCGDNLTWVLDDSGTLTISGSGNMADYDDYRDTPWFSSRRSIKQVYISDGVTSIGKYAFYNSSSLIDVRFSPNLTRIGDCAFKNCATLLTIQLPESLVDIGEEAFSGCSALVDIVIPNNVTNIGNSAFYLCRNALTLKLSSTLKKIGDMAFQNCYGLSSIQFPESLVDIGEQAFFGCNSLSSFNIPNSVTRIGSKAFKNTAYYNSHFADNVLYIGNNLIEYRVHGVDTYTVKEGTRLIADDAFNGSGVNEIIIPASVTHIGINALDKRYASVSEENQSYMSIDGNLFTKDKSVFIYHVKDSDTTLYTVPDGVKRIEKEAFSECYYITRITLPDTLEEIGDEAFYFTGIYRINIPKNVKYIGERVFIGCDDLTSITTDEDCIGFTSHDGVLYDKGMKRLICYPQAKTAKSYVIPNGVTHIDASAFSYNGRISRIVIPSSVRHIGENAFFSCSVRELIIQKGMTTIPYRAFEECSAQNTIIPDGVTTICEYAFADCSNMGSITIPASVTTIETYAFSNCWLKDVYFTGTQAQWEAINIDYHNNNLTNATIHYNCPNPYIRCTVKFNTNGGVGTYSDQSVVLGTFVSAPEPPTKNGYTFTGWYANRACTGTPYITASGVANRTVTDNLTLYAGWKKAEYFRFGIDTFSFNNNGIFFNDSEGHKISDEYYAILTKDASKLDKTRFWSVRNRDWNGSCFGMSAVMALAKIGRLYPGYFQAGAENVYDLASPRNSETVLSLVNYYMIAQASLAKDKEAKADEKKGLAALSREMVTSLKNDPYTPLVLGIDMKMKDESTGISGWCGHSILAYKVEDTDAGYKVYIADPNVMVISDRYAPQGTWMPAKPSYMIIPYDYSNIVYNEFYIDDLYSTYSTTEKTLKLDYVFEDSEIYDKPNLQDELSQQCFYNPDIALYSVDTDENVTLYTNYNSFTVSDSEKNATVTDGESDGDLDISDAVYSADSDMTEYGLNVANTYTVTANTELDEYKTNILYNNAAGFYIETLSALKPTVTFTSAGSTILTTDDVAKKTITLSTINDYVPWNSITIDTTTGKLTVSPLSYGEVEITSDTTLKGTVVTAHLDYDDISCTITEDTNSIIISYTDDYNTAYLTATGSGEPVNYEMTYSVVFASLGGSEVETVRDITRFAKITEPEAPTKDGFIFGGWYTDESYTSQWHFDKDTVQDNMILYAKWDEDPDYYCLLSMQSGEEPEQVILRKGESVDLTDFSTDLVKDGYILAGWSETENITQVSYSPDNVLNITSDTTLYPVWKSETYTVSTVTKAATGYSVETTLHGISSPCDILVAGYWGNTLVNLQKRAYTINEETFTITDTIDNVKIFVFSSLEELSPLTESEVIPSTLWKYE